MCLTQKQKPLRAPPEPDREASLAAGSKGLVPSYDIKIKKKGAVGKSNSKTLFPKFKEISFWASHENAQSPNYLFTVCAYISSFIAHFNLVRCRTSGVNRSGHVGCTTHPNVRHPSGAVHQLHNLAHAYYPGMVRMDQVSLTPETST